MKATSVLPAILCCVFSHVLAQADDGKPNILSFTIQNASDALSQPGSSGK